MRPQTFLKRETERFRTLFTRKRLLTILLGAAILSFGLYNIHRRTNITEGGIIGLVLLMDHHFGVPPWITTVLFDGTCYFLGWRFLGSDFLRLSAAATLSVAGFLRFWELFPPVLPDLSPHPLLAALLGGLAVGLGCGLIVRQGGSSGGDDALALIITKKLHWRISRSYLFTDVTVLFLSLTYIPLRRIAFSLITVTVSSFLIDMIQNFGKEKTVSEEETPILEECPVPAEEKGVS